MKGENGEYWNRSVREFEHFGAVREGVSRQVYAWTARISDFGHIFHLLRTFPLFMFFMFVTLLASAVRGEGERAETFPADRPLSTHE